VSEAYPPAKEHRVRVIFDPEFSERLTFLPTDESVWIANSSINTPVAKRLWAERPNADITTFDVGATTATEEEVLSMIETVDLHHGAYSAQPPYSELVVIGCRLDADIKTALEEIGLRVVAVTESGFTAHR
jgi:hypothetical protein